MLASVAMNTFHHPSLNNNKAVKKEDRIIKTGPCILTFNSLEKASGKIQIGYLSVPVDTYISNPLDVSTARSSDTDLLTAKIKLSAVTVQKNGMEKTVKYR